MSKEAEGLPSKATGRWLEALWVFVFHLHYSVNDNRFSKQNFSQNTPRCRKEKKVESNFQSENIWTVRNRTSITHQSVFFVVVPPLTLWRECFPL